MAKLLNKWNEDKEQIKDRMLDSEHVKTKEMEHDAELRYADNHQLAIANGHEGNRTVCLHEIDRDDSHQLAAAAFSSRDREDYNDREDIVMVSGPNNMSVFVKLEIGDIYAEKCGLGMEISPELSQEDRDKAVIAAFGGKTYEFGDFEYIKDEMPSSSWGEFLNVTMDVLKEADMRDHPERDVEIESPEKEPEINGR